MPQLEFLCGCISGNVENRENINTMSSVTYDEDDMLVCAIHRQRRKNWRAMPRLPSLVEVKGELRAVETDLADSSFLVHTPAQIEAYMIFKEPILESGYLDKVDFDKPDRRDARDPATLGTAILKNRATRNGDLP